MFKRNQNKNNKKVESIGNLLNGAKVLKAAAVSAHSGSMSRIKVSILIL
jgi:hypothetical protein